jgi:Glycosyl transferases group 1/DUF based on E. rectale Gene description (DUF3880)
MCKETLVSGLPRGFSFKTLEKNLEALSKNQLKLVQRISWPVDGSHIIFDDDKVTYKLHSSEFVLSMPNGQLIDPTEVLENGNVVFVFGIGLGEQIDFLLEQFPDRKIMVWDRDPWLVRLFLMQKDYCEAISSGNLKLFLGTDLISFIPRIDKFTIIYHRLLKEIYHNEAELILSGIGEKRILINEGGLFVDDVVLFLKDYGYTPFYLNLSKISMEEIEYAIIQFMPSIIFSINYQNGLSELCNKFSMKLLCWEIDPSVDLPASLSAKDEKSHIFTYRKKSIDDFIAASFQNVHYLPLASNAKKRHPEMLSEEEKNRYMCPVSFVGSSMTGQAEEYTKSLENYYKAFCRHHRISYDEPVNPFKKILKIQGRDYSTYRIPELTQTYLGDFLKYLKENMDQPVDPVILLAEKAASEKRLTYLSQLGRYSLKVWGDEGWKRLESDGIRYMGYAGHKYEINKIYSASLINIDINRLYQADMVNMRVFDIMACGGFVIAEYSEDLTELFAIDDEVVTFRTFDELLEKVDYYLSNTDKAREIAFRGMTAVRERHTIEKRVEQMLNIIT